jgi:hypothetical protein
VRIDSNDRRLGQTRRQAGSRYVEKDVAFIADVQAVDRKTQMITLRGARKTIQLKIKDPEQLKLINKGDQIEGVYSEAVAVSVVPAPRQESAIGPSVLTRARAADRRPRASPASRIDASNHAA